MTNRSFSNFLVSQIITANTTPADLARDLNYKSPLIVDQWVAGEGLPDAGLLPRIIEALNADPVIAAMAWLSAKVPELAEPLQAVVIEQVTA
ncbi:hypothetical protein C1707_23450 [Caulobacter flavus]|nr:hypothetical protein [Caulobacter flavus]AYV48974.1 hypothetical protein C1707_23450 [Caulobacter flavus]